MTECLIAAQREERLELRGESEVVIQRRHDRLPRYTFARLLDLSPSGAKLSTDMLLPLEESVTLLFRFGELKLKFMVDAQIRWTRPLPDGMFWMGCTFSPTIPEEYLASLAGEGYLERRREARRKLDFATTARLELSAHQDVAVRIVDLSSGGVGLRSPWAAAPRQRVLVHTEGSGGEQLLVPTRCQWQVEEADGFLLGCSFIDATGFARLAEAARLADLTHALPTPPPRRSWFWPWK